MIDGEQGIKRVVLKCQFYEQNVKGDFLSLEKLLEEAVVFLEDKMG